MSIFVIPCYCLTGQVQAIRLVCRKFHTSQTEENEESALNEPRDECRTSERASDSPLAALIPPASDEVQTPSRSEREASTLLMRMSRCTRRDAECTYSLVRREGTAK